MNNKYNTKPEYWEKAKKYLIKHDSILRKVIESIDNKHYLTRNSTPFQTLANAIIGQQISVAAASSVLKKLKLNINGFTPKKVYSAGETTLKNAGLSRQKVEYLTILASKFVTNPNYFYGFRDMSDKDVIKRLCELKGIGEWTAQMYLIFQLNRSNVMPLADIGFVNSAIRIYSIKEPRLENLSKVSEKWGCYKTVAVWYIWRIIDPEVVQY
jgi:DNA-3-methyladenine glycosylase II